EAGRAWPPYSAGRPHEQRIIWRDARAASRTRNTRRDAHTHSRRQNTMTRITSFDTVDIRFPTSEALDGSDAMNPDPDYSAAYLVLHTDSDDGLEGHAFVFTIGRGNDLQTDAVGLVASEIGCRELEPLLARMGDTARALVGDSQLRWLGPEKGVIHMAIGAVINALWDLKAKRAGMPLWQVLARM